jgi:hypothetical protein
MTQSVFPWCFSGAWSLALGCFPIPQSPPINLPNSTLELETSAKDVASGLCPDKLAGKSCISGHRPDTTSFVIGLLQRFLELGLQPLIQVDNGLSHPQFNPPARSKSIEKPLKISAKSQPPTAYKPPPTKKLFPPVELGCLRNMKTPALSRCRRHPRVLTENAESVLSFSPALPRESSVVASGLWPDPGCPAPAGPRESLPDERISIWAMLDLRQASSRGVKASQGRSSLVKPLFKNIFLSATLNQPAPRCGGPCKLPLTPECWNGLLSLLGVSLELGTWDLDVSQRHQAYPGINFFLPISHLLSSNCHIFK